MDPAECLYWVGQVPGNATADCSTVVVMTSLSIRKDDLKKNYKNKGIKLMRTYKSDTRLTHTQFAIVSRHTRETIIPKAQGSSSVLRTVLSIHRKNDKLASGGDFASAFERQCSVGGH